LHRQEKEKGWGTRKKVGDVCSYSHTDLGAAKGDGLQKVRTAGYYSVFQPTRKKKKGDCRYGPRPR